MREVRRLPAIVFSASPASALDWPTACQTAYDRARAAGGDDVTPVELHAGGEWRVYAHSTTGVTVYQPIIELPARTPADRPAEADQ